MTIVMARPKMNPVSTDLERKSETNLRRVFMSPATTEIHSDRQRKGRREGEGAVTRYPLARYHQWPSGRHHDRHGRADGDPQMPARTEDRVCSQRREGRGERPNSGSCTPARPTRAGGDRGGEAAAVNPAAQVDDDAT